MRLLAVPNWSSGQNPSLLERFRQVLDGAQVAVHYVEADADHGRTVTAFSGDGPAVESAMAALCEVAFPRIDMRDHQGVHPCVGALDVCPFVPLDPGENVLREALALAERVAARIGGVYGVPVFLYERSERGRHEGDLPTLRRGGFHALFGRDLRPDFGPSQVHPTLGATILGVRDFLIAFNVDLATDDLSIAKDIAREIRNYRADGDPRFLGVRALGFPLASRNLVQVSMNLTLPDLTPVDPIVDWVESRAAEEGVLVAGTELIGVIRESDLRNAGELDVRASQIVR